MIKNWRTSLAGLAAILSIIAQSPDVASTLQNPEKLSIIAAGIGLILSRDARKEN